MRPSAFIGTVLVGLVVSCVWAESGSRIPSFAVRVEGTGLREYQVPSGSDESGNVSDDEVDAHVSRLQGDEWQLTISPKRRALTTVWFPWDPEGVGRTRLGDQSIVYYPSLLGVAVATKSLGDRDWKGSEYPGQCFAPLVVIADAIQARMVAATTWPPRRLSPVYTRDRIALRYDERLEPGARRSYRALIVAAVGSPDELPWQRALDSYKSWLHQRLVDAGLEPSSPPWLRAANGWLNVELQDIERWDPERIRQTWERWKERLPWLQFWGQMSGYFRRDISGSTGCCLESMTIYPRYQPELTELLRRAAQSGHVGLYARPRTPYRPLVGTTDDGNNPDMLFLRSWLERNRSYGANAFYIDVIGHRYFGDPLAVAKFLKTGVDPSVVIEYPVDVYSVAFLASGSLNGGVWKGGPERSPDELGSQLDRTTFPRFGRYLLDDRILFLGESNGDGIFWGPASQYWAERQAFLLGAKFDVMHPTENGRPDGPEDRALVLAIAARDRVGWWAREPQYLDRRGLRDLPPDIDVRRYRGRDGEDLLVIDNWQRKRGKTVTLLGVPVNIPEEPLSIIVRTNTG